jgi:hypothetical protein
MWGYGRPIDVVKNSPYKVWAVPLEEILLGKSEIYIPCRCNIKDSKLQVKDIYEVIFYCNSIFFSFNLLKTCVYIKLV